MIKRISITIDDKVLHQIDDYVDFKKSVNPECSRSSVISGILQKHIPII